MVLFSNFHSIFLNQVYATSPITHLNEPPTFTTNYYFVNKGETFISNNIAIDDDNVVLEFWNVYLSWNTPQLISHSQMCNPIVIATIRGKNDAEIQRTPRAWNKNSTGFTLKVDNYDGNPPASTYVAYAVVESWAYDIGPIHIQAGSIYTDFVYSRTDQIDNGTPVYFTPNFVNNPAVIHMVTSNNDPSWVASSVNGNDNNRASEPTISQMSVFLQRSRASNVHWWETIDYLAVEPGHYVVNGIEIDAGQSADVVWWSSASGSNVNYTSPFNSVPQTFFTSQLWEDWWDGGFAQFHSWWIATTWYFPAVIDEDGPWADRWHTTEVVWFLVFSSSSWTLTIPNELTYTLSWGADVDKFQLSSTWLLSFLTGQDGDNPTDANGDAIYEVWIQVCDSHCASKCSFGIIQVEVDKKPILTLNWSGVIDIIQWQNFVDPGASCYDEHDWTCNVVSSGTVDNQTPGSYIIRYSWFDSNWNAADPIYRIVNVMPAVAIVSWSINIEPQVTGAIIRWLTTQDATSQISYWLTPNLGRSTPEFNIDNRSTWHTVVLTWLLSCTRYFFEVVSRDVALNEARDWVYTFITKWCPGNSQVMDDQISDVVYTWSWAMGSWSLILGSWEDMVQIQVPVGYFDIWTGSCGGTWTFFQLKQLQKDVVVGSLGTPSKPEVIRTYEFSAYCKEDEKIHIFDKNLDILIHYSDSEINWLKEDELEIFRYDDSLSRWIPLDNCQVDVQANLVSCETSHFSPFVLSTIAVYTPPEWAYGGYYKPIDYCLGEDKSGDLYDGKCDAPASSEESVTEEADTPDDEGDENAATQTLDQYLEELEADFKLILDQRKHLNELENQRSAPHLWFVLPNILPQTWTPILQRTYIRRVPTIEVDLPDESTFRLKWTYIDNLEYRKQVLPQKDQTKDSYIVIPSNWLVMPIVKVPVWSSDFEKMTSGEQIDINKYLRNGAMYYPTTDEYVGKAGNVVIFGHSSYWKNDPWRYKTHFQKIIELDPWEEVRIYKKVWDSYKRYRYTVTRSYETSPYDVEVLKPTQEPNLTLLTCTPIWGIAHRWIVKARLVPEQDLGLKIYELRRELYGLDVPYKYRVLIDNIVTQKFASLSSDERRVAISNVIKKIDKLLADKDLMKNKTVKATLDYLRMKLLFVLFENEDLTDN